MKDIWRLQYWSPYWWQHSILWFISNITHWHSVFIVVPVIMSTFVLGLLHFASSFVTSIWARWRVISPASRFFAQPFVQVQIKENIKVPRYWPLWRESTGDGFDKAIMIIFQWRPQRHTVQSHSSSDNKRTKSKWKALKKRAYYSIKYLCIVRYL